MDRSSRIYFLRPVCPRCEKRRVVRGGYLCTGCSHKLVERKRIERDDRQLEDSGLRLDTKTGELIDQHEKRTPAPPGLSNKYFFSQPNKRGIVKLLRRRAAGPEKGGA